MDKNDKFINNLCKRMKWTTKIGLTEQSIMTSTMTSGLLTTKQSWILKIG